MKDKGYIKLVIKLFFVFIILGVLIFINFLPTFSLKIKGMKEIKGEYITVFFEKEENAAYDVFLLTNTESGRISSTLGFEFPQDISIYIYDNQKTFQTKKYGLITAFFGLDWYVGDNRGTNVLLTSPANPGKVHDYDDNKYASVHEIVHAHNYLINKNMPKWIDDGVCLYLTNGNPPNDLYSRQRTPTINEIRSNNPIKFEKIGGYDFAHTYIEYLDKTFGWNKVLVFLRENNYENVFGQSEKDVYNNWIDYLRNNYDRTSKNRAGVIASVPEGAILITTFSGTNTQGHNFSIKAYEYTFNPDDYIPTGEVTGGYYHYEAGKTYVIFDQTGEGMLAIGGQTYDGETGYAAYVEKKY
jgi:hypothetical protein